VPKRGGIVKLLLYLSVIPTRAKVSCWMVLLGKVMLAFTVLTLMLSVTLAAISMVSLTLKVLALTGCKSKTCGTVTSLTVKLVVSVLLRLPNVSFAMMVTLYNPGMSVSSGTKVKLKISPAKFVIVNILLVLFGKVILAKTVSTFVVMSVTFAVMLTVCVWLILSGKAVTLITSGGVVSMVTFLNSVKLLLPALSNAVALKKNKPSGNPLKLMKLGLLLVVLSLIKAFVELNNLMVMLNKFTSVAVTLTRMLSLLIRLPGVSVGGLYAIAGAMLSSTMVLVSVRFSLLLVSLTVALMK